MAGPVDKLAAAEERVVDPLHIAGGPGTVPGQEGVLNPKAQVKEDEYSSIPVRILEAVACCESNIEA